MAAEPADRGQHPAVVAVRDVDGVGAGADLLLQRRLPPRHPRPSKYPWALGRPASEVWAEIWDDIGPRIERVLATGEATWDEALLLFLERSGYTEESYHTFSYSPLRDDDGAVVGMLCVVSEDTERVISARRMATLRDLGSDPSVRATEAEMLDSAADQLARNLGDLPFTLTYLFDDDGSRTAGWRPAGSPPGIPWRRTLLPARRPRRLAASRKLRDGPRGTDRAGGRPLRRTCRPGAWQEPPTQALAGAAAAAGRRTARVPGRGAQPPPPARRRLPRLRGAGRRAHRGRGRQRAQLPGRTAAGRGTRRTGPRQDHLLLQHQPRIPHPADADPGSGRRPAGARPTGVDEQPRGELDVIHRNGLRLAKLVNTLLDFSRIEAGRMQARYEPVDLRGGDRRTGQRLPVGRRPGRPRPRRRLLRRWTSRSTSTATCGRRWCSTCSPTR